MKRTGYNFNKGPTTGERLISAISYLTAGIVGLVWVIFTSFSGKRISYTTRFNIYQSIFLSVFYYIIRILFSILFNISQAIPFIGVLVSKIESAILRTPFILSYSLVDFIVVVIIAYLTIFALLGKQPIIPWVSDTVRKLTN